MSYNYSQLNEIIALQYAKKESEADGNWFLEESIKMSKGYIQPSNYFKEVANKIFVEKKEKRDIIEPAVYIDI